MTSSSGDTETGPEGGAEPNAADGARRRWMAVLAAAGRDELEAHGRQLAPLPAIEWLRRPETGLVMVRGRAGGTGARFNLGEMTVTRCALRLTGDGAGAAGTVGIAYLAGRDPRRAELAALFDALLQEPARQAEIERDVIAPLAAAQAERQDQRALRTAATRVEFFTLVRGDNPA